MVRRSWLSGRVVVMSGRADFTPEEWAVVCEGAPSAGVLVMSAQRGGVFRESFAMAKAYADARQQLGQSQLLDDLVGVKPKLDRMRYRSPEDLQATCLGHLTDAICTLEKKATRAEVDEYGRFVLAVAKKVAEARREDGVAVSPAEQTALAEIKSTVGGSVSDPESG
jgi:hypothetical protein